MCHIPRDSRALRTFVAGSLSLAIVAATAGENREIQGQTRPRIAQFDGDNHENRTNEEPSRFAQKWSGGKWRQKLKNVLGDNKELIGVKIGDDSIASGLLKSATTELLTFEQTKTETQLEEDLEKEGKPLPTKPEIRLYAFQASPMRIKRGASTTITVEYEAMAAKTEHRPIATLKVLNESGKVLGERVWDGEDQEELALGRNTFTYKFTAPADIIPGKYKITVDLELAGVSNDSGEQMLRIDAS